MNRGAFATEVRVKGSRSWPLSLLLPPVSQDPGNQSWVWSSKLLSSSPSRILGGTSSLFHDDMHAKTYHLGFILASRTCLKLLVLTGFLLYTQLSKICFSESFCFFSVPLFVALLVTCFVTRIYKCNVLVHWIWSQWQEKKKEFTFTFESEVHTSACWHIEYLGVSAGWDSRWQKEDSTARKPFPFSVVKRRNRSSYY